MMHKAWSRIEEVPYCFSRSYVKLQVNTALKIVDFDPNWVFSDCISSLKSPMATKWCTKLEVAWKRCPIDFQGHTSNCKVTQLKKTSNLTQIGPFRTVTPVWIHWWIWNDTQSLMFYRRRALLIFGVIHQISRSHGWKFDDLNPIWVGLLGRSQLSNPSDLPCFNHINTFSAGKNPPEKWAVIEICGNKAWINGLPTGKID